MLEALEDKIDVYAAIAEAPRFGIAGRKTVTEQLAEEIRKTDAVLNDILDNLVVVIKATQPAFATTYTNARITVDRPATV